jgi:hypothetical protein
MGKRSAFARIDKDHYDTPEKAVAPLLPWLQPQTHFIEPCYGEGALAGRLRAAGHRFAGGFDLPIDARVHNYRITDGEIFVTNPPYWGRPADLHPLIENLSNQAPTWLLMSADWLFNLGSAPLMSRLRRIIAVGRVKWIPGSLFSSKDNVAWLLFDKADLNGAIFIGRTSPGMALCLDNVIKTPPRRPPPPSSLASASPWV